VTFLAPPSSGARELLAAEPCIAETLYFEHSGSELRRGLNLFRLVNVLRQRRFRTVWILDRTTRPALAALLAGIPERIGVGLTRQRWLITNRGISQSHWHDFPIDWLVTLLRQMNVPLPTLEPHLRLPREPLAAIAARFGGRKRPWTVVGLGASHPDKDWPQASWAEFVAGLRRRALGTVFLLGGDETTARADDLIARSTGADAVNACGLRLAEAAALLQQADLFVGTDSGPMNIAAATGTDAYALFGATKVLTYSKFIHPIVPNGGPSADGMARITPADVLAQIGPRLSNCKQQG
jgi:heptosyltransferase-2